MATWKVDGSGAEPGSYTSFKALWTAESGNFSDGDIIDVYEGTITEPEYSAVNVVNIGITIEGVPEVSLYNNITNISRRLQMLRNLRRR